MKNGIGKKMTAVIIVLLCCFQFSEIEASANDRIQRLANVYSQYLEVLDKCGDAGSEGWAEQMDNGMSLQQLHDTLVNHPAGLRA